MAGVIFDRHLREEGNLGRNRQCNARRQHLYRSQRQVGQTNHPESTHYSMVGPDMCGLLIDLSDNDVESVMEAAHITILYVMVEA